MSETVTSDSCLIVLNPKAGAGKAASLQEKIKAIAKKNFRRVEIKCTKAQGHATEIATEGCEQSFDAIIAVGGDGTCNEIVNGMIRNDKAISPKTVFSLIPIGTGSDLKKTINAPINLQKAIETAATGIVKECDVGKCTGKDNDGKVASRYFINVAGFGANGDVVRRSNQSSKKLGGKITFLSATLVTAIRYQPVPVKIEWLDSGKASHWEETLLSCFIANGSYCGGGMWVGPKATMVDGRLDFTIVPQMSLHKQLIAIPRLYKGTVGGFPGITVCKGESLRATPEQNKLVPVELDGELFGYLPANFNILRGILKIRSQWG